MHIMIEWHERVHKIPSILVARMKNMRAITVYINSLFVGAKDITARVRATINDQTTLTDTMQCLREYTAVQSRSNNQYIVWAHISV